MRVILSDLENGAYGILDESMGERWRWDESNKRFEQQLTL